jgi:hypothetical protein
MTPAELEQIERDLGLTLPAEYRAAVCPFPVPALAGNSSTGLWDDAGKIVERTRELRRGHHFVAPWPEHFVAIGVDGGGCAHALDVRDGAVWWADRCHLDIAASGRVGTLAEWLPTYVKDLVSDLQDAGVNPQGTPKAVAEAERREARSDGKLMLLLIAVGLAVVVLIALLR